MKDFLKLLGEIVGKSILQGMKECANQVFEDAKEFLGQQELTSEGAE